MAVFVKFPGTTDNVSTDDVNLLDADTAHLSQSTGRWANLVVTADTDFWSGTGGAVTPNATSTIAAITIPDAFPVEASTEYTVALLAKRTAVAGLETHYRLRIQDYDSGSTVGNTTNGEHFVIVDDATVLVVVTHTTASDAATMRIVVFATDGAVNVNTSSSFIIGSVSNRLGTDTEFVPSLRIVGTLFEDIDPPDMPIVFAGDGTPLTIGEGWAGNGYHYRRYDGSNNLAPLVAQFDAEDVPVPAQLPSP